MADPAPTTTIDRALAGAVQTLRRAGIETPALDARVLVCAALELSRESLLTRGETLVSAAGARRLADYVSRRAAGEPVARIFGRREFWSLEFSLGPETLVPRPETETLIEAALADFPDRDDALRVLDLGTGSGCLLLALLSERPRATGVGIDISDGALDIARVNAARLGLQERAEFRGGDFARDPLDERFDVVLSNPPYIPEGDIDRLAREVARFEPRRALSGGEDGLAAYRALALRLPLLLGPRGCAYLEIGAGQADDVSMIVSTVGLRVVASRDDLAGIARCLTVAPHVP